MIVEVQFFGVTRRLAGGAARWLTLSDGATVADAVTALSADAALGTELRRCAFALGDAVVPPQHALRDGDRLAILPPVSGG
jgi:molybdopterin converting factor small subunit